MKILVMGGTRFNGLHLVHELVRQGHDVTTFNRGKTEAQLPPEVKRLYGDRKDFEQVREALSKDSFEAVFDVNAYVLDDVAMMVKIFEGQVSHYVFTSSTGVFTYSDILPYTEESPVDRSEGATPYAKNKIQCEQYLLSVYRERGFPATIVRPAVVYGPHNMVTRREFSYFGRLLQGRPILIPAEGKTILHNGHVDDQARGFALILGNKRAPGETYDFTGPEAITHNGYIDTLARIVGVEPKRVYLSRDIMDTLEQLIFVREGRAGTTWEYNIIYSIEKAKEQLGHVPQYDFESGHRQTFEWFMREGMLAKLEFDFSYEDQLLKRLGIS